MTQDKNILENLEFLDNILNYLIHNCKSYSCNFDVLYSHFYNRNLKTENKFNALGYYTAISESKSNSIKDGFSNFSVSDNTQAQGEKLVEACYYLMQNDYIRISPNFDLKITYEGIIKYSKGFKKEFKFENHKSILDVYNVYISIGLTMVGLIVGYFLGK